MAYNTTTWETDSNTKASANTTNSKFHIYKSVHAQSILDSGTDAYFIAFHYASLSNSTVPGVPANRYTWLTSGNLIKGYFIAEDWNPNDSSNTMQFKVYKLSPNTNGVDIASVESYTLLETVTISNANLQAEGRGIIVDFTEATCAFSKGDIMAISYKNTVDVTNNSQDTTQFNFVLKEDWNDIISSNV